MTETRETVWREPDQRERAGGRAVLFVLLGLALLGGGAYVAAYFAAGDKIPRGTTIEGVGVGGRTQTAAARVLEQGLADRVTEPLVLLSGDVQREVVPADAGLTVDYEASLAEAGAQRSWSPQWLWDYFTGGDDLEAEVALDEAAMTAYLGTLAEETDVPVQEGAVRFLTGRFSSTDARTGESLDTGAARQALAAAYLTDETEVELPPLVSQPDIDASDVREAVEGFTNPAMSGPVTLTFGDSQVRLAPGDYATALSLRPEGGELVPALNERRLDELLSGEVDGSGAPVDASVALIGGRPQVIPSEPGVTYKPQAVYETFLGLVTRPEGRREIAVESTIARPAFNTSDARALRIEEEVSTFTTYFPYAEYRNTNIGRAAEIVDGTVLKPGETFSLNDIVGERTAANGFTKGFVISDGIFSEELGGGVSQMATTTFNAAFFAGLEDVEHQPHSFYIDRYPVGREATVAWGAIDLQFANDTPYGVLVSASVTPSTPSSSGVVTVSMWSTKYWDITTTTGERYNFTDPDTRTLSTEDCYPNEGYGGFEIDIVRNFRRAGESALDHSETMHTSYTPSDTVICQPPR